jgi:hypothetical protein
VNGGKWRSALGAEFKRGGYTGGLMRRGGNFKVAADWRKSDEERVDGGDRGGGEGGGW